MKGYIIQGMNRNEKAVGGEGGVECHSDLEEDRVRGGRWNIDRMEGDRKRAKDWRERRGQSGKGRGGR